MLHIWEHLRLSNLLYLQSVTKNGRIVFRYDNDQFWSRSEQSQYADKEDNVG